MSIFNSIDWMNVVKAVACLAIMGGIFGLILAIASKIFAVHVDERVEPIQECLPGANCGGCGFAGCNAYATAIAAGKAPVNKCVACNEEAVQKIAAIMGTTAETTEKTIAFVMCSGGDKATKRFEYVGLNSCLSASSILSTGPNECKYGCIGLGDCVSACQFNAMSIVNGVAKSDPEKCVGCMACATACPKKIIINVPYSAQVTVPCASTDKGAVVRKYCESGCIGCLLCEKACENDAIHVKDNLASIDYSKCINCGNCADKCPRHLIIFTGEKVEIVTEA